MEPEITELHPTIYFAPAVTPINVQGNSFGEKSSILSQPAL